MTKCALHKQNCWFHNQTKTRAIIDGHIPHIPALSHEVSKTMKKVI